MISRLLYLYSLLVFVDAILTYFPEWRRTQWGQFIKKAADLTTRPVRKVLSPDLPFDFSHLIVILGVYLIIQLW